MLDEICPVQFIEGVNESAELAGDRFIQVRSYDRVAIQFIPSLTFLLVKIDICLVWGNIGKRETYDLKVRISHRDNPTDFLLSSGELIFEPTISGYGWRQISLNKPVVVLPRKQYWLELDSRDAMFHLGRAENGDQVSIRVMINGAWSDYKNQAECAMVRLYGRVLPVTS